MFVECYKKLPVKKDISSVLVRSAPKANAIVDNFLMLFNLSFILNFILIRTIGSFMIVNLLERPRDATHRSIRLSEINSRLFRRRSFFQSLLNYKIQSNPKKSDRNESQINFEIIDIYLQCLKQDLKK